MRLRSFEKERALRGDDVIYIFFSFFHLASS